VCCVGGRLLFYFFYDQWNYSKQLRRPAMGISTLCEAHLEYSLRIANLPVTATIRPRGPADNPQSTIRNPQSHNPQSPNPQFLTVR
jgi:hypothetical protein